jgi:ABC-type nitrate/sulfonate/bicarbonate transport system substrate-binding protein
MHKYVYQVITTLFVLALAINVAACSQATALTSELTPVTVQLSWTHQTQFTGFYAADRNGYYADDLFRLVPSAPLK